MTAGELASALLARDRAAVPEALNLVDDGRPERQREARALLDALASKAAGPALRVGVTGAPGAGKSTLLDALVRELRAGDQSVGIVAIDPSSQRSGGALLGDRFRVRASARDPGVLFRSMAARSRLGGVADATAASIEILASVFDWVFVETVGVGQSEGEVAALVDTLVFVAQPAAGDLLQFMKAGILELPDVFVVNKADLGPAAERTADELASGLGLAELADAGWAPPVILVSARDGCGIGELREALAAHRAHLEAGAPDESALATGRRDGRVALVLQALALRFGRFGVEHAGGEETLSQRVRSADGRSVASLIHQLGAEIEDALRKGRA